MLGAVFLLLACQMVGEAVARVLALPVPGPVLGMVLLFALLAARGAAMPASRRDELGHLNGVSGTLLANFSLMFLPAGVGIIQQGHVLADNWLGLVVAIAVSSLASLAVTGWVFLAVSRLFAR